MSETPKQSANHGTVVIIPGSWERIPRQGHGDPGETEYSNWDDTVSDLRKLGHPALVLSGLPSQDRDASPQDHVNAALTEIDERTDGEIAILAGYSGGGMLLFAIKEEMERRGMDTSRLRLAGITPSLPRPSAEAIAANPRLANVPAERNTEIFRNSVVIDPIDEITSMDPWDARWLLFGRASELAGKAAIGNMRPQYRLTSPELSLPAFLDVPFGFFYDPEDPVRNPDWPPALAEAYGPLLRIFIMENAGHAIHVSQSGLLAAGLAIFARMSFDHESPAERSRLFPQQRTSRETVIDAPQQAQHANPA